MNRDEPAEESFRRALAACSGDFRAPVLFGVHDRKMFTIVASDGGADSVVSLAEFTVLYPHRREPWRYYPSLAAPVLATLRELAPGRSLSAPFLVDAETLALFRFGRGTSCWFWVHAGPSPSRVVRRRTPALRPLSRNLSRPGNPRRSSSCASVHRGRALTAVARRSRSVS